MNHEASPLEAKAADNREAGEGCELFWSPLGRFGFRLATSYLLLSFLTVYGVLTVIPVVGYRFESWINLAWQWPVVWLGQHLFHLAGVAAQPHASDSRDTALDWIAAGIVIPTALVCAGAWTLLDRRRLEYRRASEWLRYALRLALIFLMLRYGLMKVFPLQMPPPSLAVLNEPVGNSSPMTLLWTLIGLHPVYEMIAGAIETTAAILLVFRRTALLGAFLTVVVMTNVLLYNVFFDVPVKLGAANVLVLAIALVAPDLHSMYRFFVLRRSVALTSNWAPAMTKRVLSVGVRGLEIVFVAFALIQFVPIFWTGYAQQRAHLKHPSPLTGEWRVDPIVRAGGGKVVSAPVLTGEGQPITAIFLEPNGSVMVRSADAKLWRAQARIDPLKHTFDLDSGYFEGERFAAEYRMAEPDPNHLVLQPVGQSAATNGTMTLVRVPLPDHYPLMDRGFYWVNEWALER